MPAGGGSKRTDITVSYRGETNNLHLFWDINVVEMAEGNPEELAKKLADSITRKQRAEWQSGEPKRGLTNHFVFRGPTPIPLENPWSCQTNT